MCTRCARATAATTRRWSARMAQRRGALESRPVLLTLPQRRGCTSGLTPTVGPESSSEASALTTLRFRSCNPMCVRDSGTEVGGHASVVDLGGPWSQAVASAILASRAPGLVGCLLSERTEGGTSSRRLLSGCRDVHKLWATDGADEKTFHSFLSPAPFILKVAARPSVVGGVSIQSPRRPLNPMSLCCEAGTPQRTNGFPI